MCQPWQSLMGFFRSRYKNFIDFGILSKIPRMIKSNRDIFDRRRMADGRGQKPVDLTCSEIPHLKCVFFQGLERHRGLYSTPYQSV